MLAIDMGNDEVLEMTKTTRLLLAAGAIALGATAFAGASLGDGGRAMDSGHGGRGGPGPRLLETFDANQDGQVTQEEIDQLRRERLAEFDQNADGMLTLEEYEALWNAAMRERMVDQFQSHDDDGDGLVTTEEFLDSYRHMVERMDRNGDGVISRDDMGRRHGDGDGRDDD